MMYYQLLVALLTLGNTAVTAAPLDAPAHSDDAPASYSNSTTVIELSSRGRGTKAVTDVATGVLPGVLSQLLNPLLQPLLQSRDIEPASANSSVQVFSSGAHDTVDVLQSYIDAIHQNHPQRRWTDGVARPSGNSVEAEAEKRQMTPMSAGVEVVGAAAAAATKEGIEIAKEYFEKSAQADWANRGAIVRQYLVEHTQKMPNRNVFVYHRYHGDFTYGYADNADAVEEQFEIKRKDIGGTTEYYNVVTFDGDGWIEKASNADGGYLNWGYWGNIVETQNGGNKIVFGKIDNPDTINKDIPQ